MASDRQITRLAIAAMLTGAAAEVVNALREKYDPRSAAAIGAHVTVAGPADTEMDIESAAGIVAEVAEQVSAFEVTVGGVRTFLPVSPVCYLEVRPQDLLRALHEELVARLGWQEQFGYTPHATIAEYLEAGETERVARELEAADFRAQDCLRVLTLLEKEASGVWVAREEFVLANR